MSLVSLVSYRSQALSLYSDALMRRLCPGRVSHITGWLQNSKSQAARGKATPHSPLFSLLWGQCPHWAHGPEHTTFRPHGCHDKGPQAEWLKHQHQHWILSQFWRPAGWNLGVNRLVLSEGWEGPSIPGLSSWTVHSRPLSPSPPTVFPLLHVCLCVQMKEEENQGHKEQTGGCQGGGGLGRDGVGGWG